MPLIDDILKYMEGKEVSGIHLVERYRYRFRWNSEAFFEINKIIVKAIDQGKLERTRKGKLRIKEAPKANQNINKNLFEL